MPVDSLILPIRAQHLRHGEYERSNPGLFAEKRFDIGNPGGFKASASGGVIRDSFGNWSPGVAGGLHYETGPLSVGMDLAGMYRKEQWRGGPREGFVAAPLPRMEYTPQGSDVGLSLSYVPRNPKTDTSDALLFAIKKHIASRKR